MDGMCTMVSLYIILIIMNREKGSTVNCMELYKSVPSLSWRSVCCKVSPLVRYILVIEISIVENPQLLD